MTDAQVEALVTLLETDTRYELAVMNGNNGLCARMLNEPDPAAQRRWRPIPVDDFLDAIAGESLTTEQSERITLYVRDRSSVPVHKANVRAWVQNQNFAASTITALRNLSEVEGRHCDPLLGDDDERVTLNDVRKAVRSIAWSFIVASGQV